MKHVHLIAICGTGMGSLAGLFKQKGFHVSGSDQNTYPPMSTELQALGVQLYQGYHPKNLEIRPDLVIVGNAVSKDNVEIVEMCRLGIPYLSMPQAISQFFMTDKKSIVIGGTHGKTTTTALAAHLLTKLGTDPSFLIGGILQGDEKNYHHGLGPYFVIEGDEYDTAYFDKGSKFLHYQPYYSILTSLEFDHADIFRDLNHLKEAFENFLQVLNPNGFLLTCAHYPMLQNLVKKCPQKKYSYGYQSGDWQIQDLRHSEKGSQFELYFQEHHEGQLHSPLFGGHNAENTLAVYTLLRELGFKHREIQEALLSFGGIKRRQEVLADIDHRVVIDDFAHHPTAVRETLKAVRARYPEHRIVALFEPRSNTSKRAIFQKDYAEAFRDADYTILADVFMPSKVQDEKILDVDQLAQDIGDKAIHISDIDAMLEKAVGFEAPVVYLVMSNGGFGGIHSKLVSALKS